jgi:Tfp pilus assembly protein PilO
MQRHLCKLLLARVDGVLIYTDSSWPLWLRVLIAVVAVALVAVFGWRYYRHYWRR